VDDEMDILSRLDICGHYDQLTGSFSISCSALTCWSRSHNDSSVW